LVASRGDDGSDSAAGQTGPTDGSSAARCPTLKMHPSAWVTPQTVNGARGPEARAILARHGFDPPGEGE
ncbi:MAG: hypothetical protein ACO3EK_16055, partial [Alphaproteobacteria bacterium]